MRIARFGVGRGMEAMEADEEAGWAAEATLAAERTLWTDATLCAEAWLFIDALIPATTSLLVANTFSTVATTLCADVGAWINVMLPCDSTLWPLCTGATIVLGFDISDAMDAALVATIALFTTPGIDVLIIDVDNEEPFVEFLPLPAFGMKPIVIALPYPYPVPVGSGGSISVPLPASICQIAYAALTMTPEYSGSFGFQVGLSSKERESAGMVKRGHEESDAVVEFVVEAVVDLGRVDVDEVVIAVVIAVDDLGRFDVGVGLDVGIDFGRVFSSSVC